MAVSDKPWNGSSANYRDAGAYCDACLVDTNEGREKVVANCKLPVKEPGGAVNRNAAHNAAARINQLDAPADAKKAAARKLVAIYRRDLKEEPPESLLGLAGMTSNRAMSSRIRRAAGREG
jgi:hypothetical protein